MCQMVQKYYSELLQDHGFDVLIKILFLQKVFTHSPGWSSAGWGRVKTELTPDQVPRWCCPADPWPCRENHHCQGVILQNYTVPFIFKKSRLGYSKVTLEATCQFPEPHLGSGCAGGAKGETPSCLRKHEQAAGSGTRQVPARTAFKNLLTTLFWTHHFSYLCLDTASSYNKSSSYAHSFKKTNTNAEGKAHLRPHLRLLELTETLPTCLQNPQGGQQSPGHGAGGIACPWQLLFCSDSRWSSRGLHLAWQCG